MDFSAVYNQYRQVEVTISGESVSYISSGKGQPVICLHGFPDHPFSFHQQAAFLSSRGYQVIMPFLRGYQIAELGRPSETVICEAQLGMDVVALIETLNLQDVLLIGHDWGCAAVYGAAIIKPSLIKGAITMSVPYGNTLFKNLIGFPVQQQKSWYYFLLASPLGELALMNNNFNLVEELWEQWTSGPWKIDPAELDHIKKMFKVNRNYKNITNYYKNSLTNIVPHALQEIQQSIGKQIISTPWLYMHGVDDRCIDIQVGRELNKKLFSQLTCVEIEQAGHFIHRDRPEEVNAQILLFIESLRHEHQHA